MDGYKITDILKASAINDINDDLMKNDYEYVFATDLMSDALAMIQTDNEKTVLLTGLCNDQALRTAEMLDVALIIFVRGKALAKDLIDNSMSSCNCYTTKYTMYEACGLLYAKGLKVPRTNV